MNKVRVILVAIILLASFFRLFDLATLPPGLFIDEAANGKNALQAASTGEFRCFYPENNGREGLYANLQALSLTVFGNHPWALRLVSALFGIATILGTYLLALEIFGNDTWGISGYQSAKTRARKGAKVIALLAAFFMAASFWHINFSRIGFRGIMAPFFLTWGLWGLLQGLRRIPSRSGFALCALSGLLFGGGFHSYIAYRITPVIFIYILWQSWRQTPPGMRREWRIAVGLWSGLGLIVLLPLALYFFNHADHLTGRTAQVSILQSSNPVADLIKNTYQTATMFFANGDDNWRHNLAGRPQLCWVAGFLFCVGLLRSLIDYRYRGKYQRQAPLLFLWMVVAALPALITIGNHPHSLRTIAMIPAIYMVAGLGGYSLWKWSKKRLSRRLRFSLASVLLMLAITDAATQYFYYWRRHPALEEAFSTATVRIGEFLNDRTEQNPAYIVVEPEELWQGSEVPVSAYPVMFITNTFQADSQQTKKIFYIPPSDICRVPPHSTLYYLPPPPSE